MKIIEHKKPELVLTIDGINGKDGKPLSFRGTSIDHYAVLSDKALIEDTTGGRRIFYYWPKSLNEPIYATVPTWLPFWAVKIILIGKVLWS